MDKQYEFLTWEQFEEDCQTIYEWAKDKNFNSVYGPPRGGLILGVKMSHLLDIPLILHKDDITPKTLVIDDISDTGRTLKQFREKGCKIATIYYHKQTETMPDKYIREKTEKWIVYPWENKNKPK